MHKISYRNTTSSWEEALPLGNGHFGAMVYNGSDRLIYAVNHYDIYYRKYWLYSKRFAAESKVEKPTDTSRYELIQKRALKVHEDPDDPAYLNYNYTLNPEFKDYYGWERKGATLPLTGEIHLLMDECVKGAHESESSLEIEEAVYRYISKTEKGDLRVSTIISQQEDIILTRVRQTGKNKINAVEIGVPERRFLEIKREFKVYDENKAYFINSFYPDGEDREKYGPFRYVFMLKLCGAKSKGTVLKEGSLKVDVAADNTDFDILACVVTDDEKGDIVKIAAERLDKAGKDIQSVVENHDRYWNGFWSKSSISITDKLLENLWYINIYSLECCSGKGARLHEQACGLNGLWDIKQPSQWGSLWYWDVNIEQSFWPVYTSNHLETGEAFYKGLLSYVEAAKKKAREFYGFRGIAPDYPFEFFICLWPWCAQYFWWHYRYSGDVVFLKEKAYPLFKDILLFFEDYLKYDEIKNEYYIFPDLSPEQGPLTRNSTITLGCLKFLLKIAGQANEILNENVADRIRWKSIHDRLPFYPMGESVEFGKTIKDSEWALPTQYQAHGSPLMPIYPIGDISKRSSEDIRIIARDTINYVGNSINLCTHTFGWEACAAARLGFGNDAVSHLYEKGIAYQMRTNGLFAEETERWIQNCVTALTPSYHPPLIEAGSATAAALNEMLLQSFNGVIEVFPALPSGIGQGRIVKKDRRNFDNVTDCFANRAEGWKDCSFENLLAEGAFEVSAYQDGSRTCCVRIRSLAGNRVKLVNPFNTMEFLIRCIDKDGKDKNAKDKDVKYELAEGLIVFETQKGCTYELYAEDGKCCCCNDDQTCCRKGGQYDKPLVYTAPTKRRVFLGKDQDTDFLRDLDNITFDYYQGDVRTSRIAVYRFDFGMPGEELAKDYRVILPKQFHACGKLGLDFFRVTKDTGFTPYLGYGWKKTGGLEHADRGAPDPLRRDFVCGLQDNTFAVEVTKGQYQVFIGMGDASEPSYTAIEINGQQKWNPENMIMPGRFEAAVLPVLQREDGIMEINVSTAKGLKWKINMIIINHIL